jgi:flagellar biosynthesis/type III secretory pathway protein FliH
MLDEFVPFEVFLRAPAPETFDDSADCVPIGDDETIASETPVDDRIADEEAGEMRQALSEIRRFRAALADALDFALEALLHDIAAGVLGRELQIAPADIACIVAQSRRRYADEPVALRVHPSEVELATATGLAVEEDRQLRRGDATIVLRAGTIDLSLGARLAALFER